MPIVDLYSKRQKKLRGEGPDVYVYDDLPKPLRVQIVKIWDDNLGVIEGTFSSIVDTLCHEYGVHRLLKSGPWFGAYYELVTFFHQEKCIDKVLDVIELSFRTIEDLQRNRPPFLTPREGIEAINELNERFKEHGVGCQFVSGNIIRIDSELIHSEIVKPALNLLAQQHYAGAQDEFLKAHEHYRAENAKEALNECLKAFESVMKAICDKRGWSYNQNATATSLIKVCFDNELIPKFWDAHYSSLRSLLESGVPTGRNKSGGHGQGTHPVTVPNHLAAYMLHMTASAIVFLAEAEKQLP